ncbi:chalcone and stilbene synthase domain protein [Catenulispora acidiphila DSM 44928]|uniref:Chalcone and stilbene synthase domain protein n=1 Tax=Catenulispora acidiphila (strain DSM 44928 / JCM 14897 / NBRC 102108 / NRRL B-24433 / ID139908) TaxID=479433 RepID=C7QG46_CATAD|nr:3-oxoacyl-[acyl-carrier-protein] synthase III C-terminal domain-containing protein [Catenulispora acidiphila]ACU71023.1 chalcone and stilbene synthase domain protein [Catenulispora acidiphila DSM 44928]
MSRIAAVSSALPSHRHRQDELASATADLCALPATRRALLDRLYSNAGVDTRHTVLPLTGYRRLDSVDRTNDTYIEHATELGEQAVASALRQAGVAAEDVDLFVTTSVTGVSVPSLDARLVPRLGMRPDVKRVPMFGLGCVAGAAGLSRIHDYLMAWPDHTAVLLAVELCSLSVPLVDPTVPDLVVSALFGDGAGAVVVHGADRRPARDDGRTPSAPRVRIVATRSELCPNTHDVLGWHLGPHGFRIVLTTELADVVERELGGVVKRFLADHALQVPDVAAWVVHPGGPKVIDAVRDSLELPEERVATARAALAETGNLSSASIVHVLARELAAPDAAPGPMVIVGLGPGVSIELLLLERLG